MYFLEAYIIYQARAKRGRPQAFHELRRYHTRPIRLNWGPKNVHFGKTQFRDPNINVKILFSDIAYKDKSLGKIPFLKKLTLWFI